MGPSSVPAGKWRNSTSIRLGTLRLKLFTISYSTILLPFKLHSLDAKSIVKYPTWQLFVDPNQRRRAK
jgi:hypothetical protein